MDTIKESDDTFSFKIVHNNNLLNIFFDKISYEIKGWTTTDIYLNKVETIKENDETFSFKIAHNNNLLNIFFDKTSYEIKGWTTTDIYLNTVETKLFNIKTNIMIDDRLFKVQNYIN